MKTGFVIIHYNDYESLVHLIHNIKDYKVLDKIIIYDNNSNEVIRKKIEKLKSKKIDIIISEENKGYSYAINEATKYLVNKIGECNIIVSNSDVVIALENDIKNLLLLLSKKDVGLVAPTIFEKDHLNRGWKDISPLLDSVLNIVWIHKFFRKRYVFYKDDHYSGDNSYVDIVSGCFFLIKSKVLENINYLDENVFLYYEENILAKKLKKIGLKVLISNEIMIVHNHSVSIDKNLKKIQKLKKQKQSQYYFQVNYNHANKVEKILLKTTAFINRQILKVVYFIKSLKNN